MLLIARPISLNKILFGLEEVKLAFYTALHLLPAYKWHPPPLVFVTVVLVATKVPRPLLTHKQVSSSNSTVVYPPTPFPPNLLLSRLVFLPKLPTTVLQYRVMAPCDGPPLAPDILAITGIFKEVFLLPVHGQLKKWARLNKVNLWRVKARFPRLPKHLALLLSILNLLTRDKTTP